MAQSLAASADPPAVWAGGGLRRVLVPALSLLALVALFVGAFLVFSVVSLSVAQRTHPGVDVGDVGHVLVEHSAELASRLPWMARLDPARRRVLQNMAFNLGVGEPGGRKGLLGFRNTLGMIERGEYAAAADAMLKSLWARQVGQRAVRLSNTMRTGQ